MNIQQAIHNYIAENTQSKLEEIGSDEDLLDAGFIDSLGIIQLVSFLEGTFAIQIPDEDITVSNFRSIRAITSYLYTHNVREVE